MTVKLEKVTLHNQNDLLKITALPEQAPYSGNGELLTQHLNSPDKTVYLFYFDDQPLACFYLMKEPHYLTDFIGAANHPCYLMALTVNADHQGKGIGLLAMEALIEQLKDTECDAIALSVNCKNPAAIRLYEKAGFHALEELYYGGNAGPQYVMVYSF